jgi:adenylate cyclase
MSILTYFKKPSRMGVLLGLVCALAAWEVAQTPTFLGLEEWLYDGAFSLRGQRTTRARVILIGIDDDSLDELQKPAMHISPEIAEVVAYAKAQGASAIGLDLIVPSSLTSLPELQEDGPGDATKLGRAIQDAGNVVLAEWKLKDRWLQPVWQWRAKSLLDPGQTDFGVVDLTQDEDRFERRQWLLRRDGAASRMHFSLALFVQAQHIKKVEWDDENEELLLDGETVPLDAEQKLRINYVGPPETFPVLPLREVLAAARAGKKTTDFGGSIVIIGVNARSQHDYYATPFDNNFARSFYSAASRLMSGMEIHANIIATLQDRAYIVAPPPFVSFGILLAVGALMGRVLGKLNLVWGFVLTVAFHAAWKHLAYAALTWFYWRIDVVAPLLMGMAIYSLTFLQRWWTMRQTLSVVKSENVARFLEDDPRQLDRSGEERTVTVLFADIRGFTSYSEQHSAQEVVTLLNTYFTELVPIIEEHGGTLNQYMGDGMMVIFGAPVVRPNHAVQAVLTATAMVKRIRAKRERWAELGFPDLRIGVGVHTGRVVVGMVGSPKRLDYTAIGDTVNTAARIEAQTKEFGMAILISAETLRELPAKRRGPIGCAAQGKEALLKGKPQPMMLYAVSVEP